MSNVILIRHAQASLGKANYDELSEMGFKQAGLLVKYLNTCYQKPCSIISGTMTRHQQTASEIAKAYPEGLTLVQDSDWNEFDFKKLIQLYLKIFPQETPEAGDIGAFFGILKKSMLAWSNNKLDHQSEDLESWSEFSSRVDRALSKLTETSSNTPQLIVSSGGAIAIKLMKILETTPKTMINLNFQIRNTSFTELLVKPEKINLVTFNQINHFAKKLVALN